MRKILTEKQKEELLKSLRYATSERYFVIYEALRKGASVEEIHELTKVKHYFLEQMKELVEEEEALLAFKGGFAGRQCSYRGEKKTDSLINI